MRAGPRLIDQPEERFVGWSSSGRDLPRQDHFTPRNETRHILGGVRWRVAPFRIEHAFRGTAERSA